MTTRSIGRYRIEAALGSGRYCETFQAFDLVHRRSVALKLLHPELFSDPNAWRGFLSEIQKATDLIHPHIAWIWETDELDGRYYLVERFIGGETLGSLITKSGPLPTDQAIKALEEIAQAIEFGQQHSWTHGCLTPRNILISPDLGAVLSDYGLLSAVHLRLSRSTPDLADAPYLPPETLRGAPLSPSGDIYGLACCLVEALSGSNPFSAPTLDGILEKKTSAYQSLQLPIESVPQQAAHVIERALNPDPAKRFKYALDFVDTFERNVRHGLTDAAGRAQHEEQLQRWREAQEQERINSEEISRMEAVENARREIHERARQEAEQAVQQYEPALNMPLITDQPVLPADRVKDGNLNGRRPALIILRMVLLGMLIFGAVWLKNRGLRTGGSVEIPTATNQITSPTEPLQTEPGPVITSQLSPTDTELPSPTFKPTVTRTPPASPTSSQTPTMTVPIPTSTQERPKNNTNPNGD